MSILFALLPSACLGAPPAEEPASALRAVVSAYEQSDDHARRIVRQFEDADVEQRINWTPERYTRIARAYARLGKPDRALGAMEEVSDAWLVEHGELETKLSYYRAWNSPYLPDGIGPWQFGAKDGGIAAEFMFIQRCLDMGYGDRGRMMLHKASFLCRSSAGRSYSRFTGWSDLVSRPKRYEQSFAVLRQALESEPELVGDLGFFSPFTFPVLEKEPRYEELLEQARQRVEDGDRAGGE